MGKSHRQGLEGFSTRLRARLDQDPRHVLDAAAVNFRRHGKAQFQHVAGGKRGIVVGPQRPGHRRGAFRDLDLAKSSRCPPVLGTQPHATDPVNLRTPDELPSSSWRMTRPAGPIGIRAAEGGRRRRRLALQCRVSALRHRGSLRWQAEDCHARPQGRIGVPAPRLLAPPPRRPASRPALHLIQDRRAAWLPPRSTAGAQLGDRHG